MLHTLLEDTSPVVGHKSDATVIVLHPFSVGLDLLPSDPSGLSVHISNVDSCQKADFDEYTPKVGQVVSIREADHAPECVVLRCCLRCCVQVRYVELLWD